MHGNKGKLKRCVTVLNEEQIFVAASSLAGNGRDNINVFPVMLIKGLWSIPAKISPDAAVVPVDSQKKPQTQHTYTKCYYNTCIHGQFPANMAAVKKGQMFKCANRHTPCAHPSQPGGATSKFHPTGSDMTLHATRPAVTRLTTTHLISRQT